MSARLPEIILASRSPRRASLLAEAGVPFRCVPPSVEEGAASRRGDPRRLAVANALAKARSVAPLHPDRIVLGADTIVLGNDGRIYGKPATEEEAFLILSSLSGTTHSVVTGVALLLQARNVCETFFEETRVTMRRVPPAEIIRYVTAERPYDKAGSYAIQEGGDAFVERIEGDFSNVVGLPVAAVTARLEKIAARLR